VIARAARCLGLALAALVALAAPARRADGHLLRGTTVFLDIGQQVVQAQLQIPLDQLALALQRPLDLHVGALPPAVEAELRAYVGQHVAIQSGVVATADATADAKTDATPPRFAIDLRALTVERIVDGDCLVARIFFRPPAGASVGSFTFVSDVVLHRVVTHRIYVLVRSDFQSARLGGEPQLVGILRYQVPVVHVDRDAPSWWRGFRAVFMLGVRHIAEGRDHLLFLIMLLLPAPLVADRRWLQARDARWSRTLTRTIKVVTAFSIGHSATLIAGTFGSLRVPGQLVEVLIAVSILVTAIHALRPLFPGWEPLIAAGFGLVHGLAFATVLAGFGFDRSVLAWSLLGFNLGIEAAQLVVLIAVVPPLSFLSRFDAYRFVRIAGALFGCVAALGWIGERAFGFPGLSALF
jgi:hypothetical protein